MFAILIPFIERYAATALRSVLTTLMVHQVDKAAQSLHRTIATADWPWWLKGLATHALEAFITVSSTPEDAADVAAATLKSWLGQLVVHQMAQEPASRSAALNDFDILGSAVGGDPPDGQSLLSWLRRIQAESGVDLETLLELREIHRAGKEAIL